MEFHQKIGRLQQQAMLIVRELPVLRIKRASMKVIAACMGFASASALAQHAADNAVVAAEDAFGFTIGTETIGLYTSDQVRGFSPQVAGNARVGALYFDQQTPLSPRVLEGSTIRVGINTVAYAFPAPTGIVDYDLRHVSDKAALTAVADVGPFGAWGIDLDGQFLLSAANLSVPLGISERVDALLPGLTKRTLSFGTSPQWKPTDATTIRAFFDYQHITDARTAPLAFMAADALPPRMPARYVGQRWAGGDSVAENEGTTIEVRLNPAWTLKAGLFRSALDTRSSYAELLVDTSASGIADHQLIGFPDQRVASTSGEARISGKFPTGPVTEEFLLSVRGRHAVAHYGGTDVAGFGPASVGVVPQEPLPSFLYSATTRDENTLWIAGAAYQLRWSDRVQLSIGIQKSHYEKTVAQPDAPLAHRNDAPWLAYAAGTVTLTSHIAAYTGFTQGIEDSGIAPSNATNRGEVLPAARTWQREVGLQIEPMRGVKVIAAIFDVHKPYYNLNSTNTFVALGKQQRDGFEFSLAGEVLKNLNVVAGLATLNADITGVDTAAKGLGTRPVGLNRSLAQVNFDYRLPAAPAWSIDATYYYFGRRAANLANTVWVPATNSADLGVRYQFSIAKAPASVRLLMQNVANVYSWALTDSGGFSPGPGRSFQAYLTADL